jgi:signal peptidase II
VSNAEATPEQPRRRRAAGRAPRLALVVALAAFVLIADISSKIVVVARLSDRAPVRLLGGSVYLLETRNSGAAFSLGQGAAAATLLFTAIAIVVVVVIIRMASRLRSAGWAIALGLILGGALGNLSDRIVRSPGIGRGHVVDWISVFSSDGSTWPIFNLADSAISCGAVLAVLLALRGVEFDGRKSDSTPQLLGSDASDD